MASAMKCRPVRLEGREAPFVAAVADLFHAVDNAPRVKTNAAIGANELGPAGNRIHFHVCAPSVSLSFSAAPPGEKFHRLLIKQPRHKRTNTVFARIARRKTRIAEIWIK